MQEDLNHLIRERLDKQEEIEQKKRELNEINGQLWRKLEGKGSEKYEDLTGSAQIIRPAESVNYDWNKLRQLIGQITWNKITVQVPSDELLEDAVARGDISPSVLAKCIVKKPGRQPYVKVVKSKD